MKSSFRVASRTLFALETGVSADASGTEVNASASGSTPTTTTTTTSETTTKEQLGGSGTP
jgi:hypothetical protein